MTYSCRLLVDAMTKPKQTQIEKFKQAARDLEADDSEKRFNDRLRKIAKQKPSGALLEKPATAKKPK
jgi:hypothetical protein